MPAAGWYPDPDGTPGRNRYWNGSAWTDLTSSTPAPTGGGGHRGRSGLIVGVLVLVLIVVVITALVIRSRRADPDIDDNPPQSTASAWNDSSPLPTGRKSAERSVQPVPSGHPQDCEQYDTSRSPTPPADGRVHGGPLSFAQLGHGWSRPYASNRFPFSKDAYLQTEDLPQKLPWQASVEVGENTMHPFPGADQATAELLQCLVSSDFYTSVHVKVTENSSKPIMISNTRAVQRDALLRFHHPELTTTGSRIRIIVVDSDPVTYYFSAVPMERADLISQLDQATASLRLGG
jgi:hypothetical protein